MLRSPAAFVLLLVIAASAFAQDAINADRPGIADSSGVVGRGVFQLEIGVEQDHERAGGIDQRTVDTPTLLRYGLTKALEVRLEGNGYERMRSCDGGICETEHDWAPASIGAKYRFLDHPSMAVIARAFVLHASPSTGDVRLAADVDLDDEWSLNPNVGLALEDDGHGRRTTKGLAALTVTHNLSPAANVFVDGGLDGSQLLLDVGGAWIVGRDTQLDLSVGWGAHGEGAPNVFWSAGISRRF
jgi:hypothetical protein